MNQEAIEQMIRDILQEANTTKRPAAVTESKTSGASVTTKDYPLSNKRPELVKTFSNKSLDDITLDRVISGEIKPVDVRITPETLKLQAQIAEDAGRPMLAQNFGRAAELTAVPDERILDIYNALRPYRSSQEELLQIANELETKYKAVICANFVREAAELYKVRKKLKGDN
ncbi:diol dehydratase small subunit [Bacillaceae bacterium Marseille-Q3522]|nr:diol dehydratase small subunit [Bacillaceae bacterium Marseille-Q3522]